ncbi:tyrosine-protein phosphatase [Nocardioides sp. NPDC057772]|uniref:tyrosine-protein phosphatase n=1 Tax=Nocardioides sp. NPDC057772 TaxID=3346245 RepID=UPI00366FF4AC
MTLTDDGLELSAPVNLRDMGGIPIAGGTLRDGLVIRADDLALADEASASRLVDGGLAAVIDLRSAGEFANTGRGPLGRMRVTYHHLPFMDAVDSSAQVPGSDLLDQSTFAAMYIRMYEAAAARIVTSLAVIATAPGATAFHCAAGQDRTGVLAASLLLALGAEHDAIVDDYARTGANSSAIMARLAPVMGPMMAALGIELDEAARASMRKEFSPEPMKGLLHHLSASYRDPLEPLRRAGLNDAIVAMLRERALG